jgi:hypothetical protein
MLRINCSYNLWIANKTNYQSERRLQSPKHVTILYCEIRRFRKHHSIKYHDWKIAAVQAGTSEPARTLPSRNIKLWLFTFSDALWGAVHNKHLRMSKSQHSSLTMSWHAQWLLLVQQQFANHDTSCSGASSTSCLTQNNINLSIEMKDQLMA